MLDRTFAHYWAPAADDRTEGHPLPDGPAGALIVLIAWLALGSAWEFALDLSSVPLPILRWLGPVVLFTVALVWVRLIRRAEVRRLEAIRLEARAQALARLRAYQAERMYYVIDVIGAKRGPYPLDALVRWRERGKLDESAVIYIGDAPEPVPFSRVAAHWRERWGDSMFDPPALRRAG